ncbi:MAG: DMT family transporter [Bacteroidetes bacterium]|nr:DMT family transporter [Bacteroidota bacterium]
MKVKNLSISVTYVILISISIIILRYLSVRFESATMNAWRFLSGFLGLLILLFLRKKGSEIMTAIRSGRFLLGSLIIAVLLTLNMYAFIRGISLSDATTGSLVKVVSLPFIIIMTMSVFKEERKLFGSRLFKAGLILVLAGTYFFIQSGSRGENGNNYVSAWIFFSIVIIVRGFQNIMIKKNIAGISVHTTSIFTSFWSCIFFFLISWFTEGGPSLTGYSPGEIGMLIFSGVFGLFTGMGIAFFIIRNSGIIYHDVLSLAAPVVTSIFSYLLLKETLSLYQWISGAVILTGCYLAIILPSLRASRANRT